MNPTTNRPTARQRAIARAERMAGHPSTPQQRERAQQAVERSMVRTFGELQFETALTAAIREDNPEDTRPRQLRPSEIWAGEASARLEWLLSLLRALFMRVR